MRVKTYVTIEGPVTISAKNGHAQFLLGGERNPWSLKLCFHPGDDDIVGTAFQTRHGLQGYDDTLHGGVIDALLDAAVTHCPFHHEVHAVTRELYDCFVQPVSCTVSCNSVRNILTWVSSSFPSLYPIGAEPVHDKRVMAWAEANYLERGVLQWSPCTQR